jgi:renalase
VTTPRVLVVGAGMAGLTAARRLDDAGWEVVVVDKGRGVGGRMATRRIGAAVADHGAQFFTARSDWFAERVEGWLGDGVAREWCRGFHTPPDGHPRYVGASGMTAVAKALAEGLDVLTATRLDSVARTEGGWQGVVEGGGAIRADAVVVTSPVPQTLDLLAAGGVELDTGVADALGAIRYSPTLAALVVTSGPASVPDPGGRQLSEGPISWVGDNLAKGISPVPAVTLHASPEESAARYDEPAEAILATLVAAGAGYLGDGDVADAQLARWRFAQPAVSYDQRHLVAVDGAAPLVCAGDAFGEAKVEGAARSGWSAAGALLEQMG